MDRIDMTLGSDGVGALEGRARRSYERGRGVWAATRGAGAAGLAALALYGCPDPGAAVFCAAALGLMVSGALWRGGSWAAGARAGFAAGMIPCLLPAAVRISGVCELSGPQVLPLVCVAGGLLAGLTLGFRRARGARAAAAAGESGPPDVSEPRRFWLAAGAAAILAGCVGCLPVGVAGMAGLGIGMALGAAPMWMARRFA